MAPSLCVPWVAAKILRRLGETEKERNSLGAFSKNTFKNNSYKSTVSLNTSANFENWPPIISLSPDVPFLTPKDDNTSPMLCSPAPRLDQRPCVPVDQHMVVSYVKPECLSTLHGVIYLTAKIFSRSLDRLAVQLKVASLQVGA